MNARKYWESRLINEIEFNVNITNDSIKMIKQIELKDSTIYKTDLFSPKNNSSFD